MAKIHRIIQQIQDGTYRMSSEKIAEKLLKKNPKLSDKVSMETRVIGDMKYFSITDYMDEGFDALVSYEFKFNGIKYGQYLIGVYSDGTTIELDFEGDHFVAFDDDGTMEDAFETDLKEHLTDLGLNVL